MAVFRWLAKRYKGLETPPFWRAYEALFRDKPARGQAVETVSFVVFDTETTGLNIKKDRILSIGAVRVENRQIDLGDSFECLIRQDRRPSDRKSIGIHGILPVKRPEDLEEEQAIQSFLKYVGNDVLVGHHVLFDIGVINESLRRMRLGKLKNKYLDTARLAARAQGRYHLRPGSNLGLDELCRQYGISPADRHTAAGDAYLTAVLFLKMLWRLEKRGVRKLGDLLR